MFIKEVLTVSKGYSIEERALGSKARQDAHVAATSERKMRGIETEDKPTLVLLQSGMCPWGSHPKCSQST